MSDRTRKAIEEIRRWSTVVLLVMVLMLGWQVSQLGKTVNHLTASTNRTEASADDARTAATGAKKALEEAIAQSRDGSVDSSAVLDALRAIHRIEIAICGGTCPDPGH